MTAGPREITEQDLQAYVDGWLDPARLSAVEAYLSERPDEAARLAARLRAEFGLKSARIVVLTNACYLTRPKVADTLKFLHQYQLRHRQAGRPFVRHVECSSTLGTHGCT